MEGWEVPSRSGVCGKKKRIEKSLFLRESGSIPELLPPSRLDISSDIFAADKCFGMDNHAIGS
jgi:hypothetical protein